MEGFVEALADQFLADGGFVIGTEIRGLVLAATEDLAGTGLEWERVFFHFFVIGLVFLHQFELCLAEIFVGVIAGGTACDDGELAGTLDDYVRGGYAGAFVVDKDAGFLPGRMGFAHMPWNRMGRPGRAGGAHSRERQSPDWLRTLAPQA